MHWGAVIARHSVGRRARVEVTFSTVLVRMRGAGFFSTLTVLKLTSSGFPDKMVRIFAKTQVLLLTLLVLPFLVAPIESELWAYQEQSSPEELAAAQRALDEGRWEDAVSALRKLLELDSNNSRFRQALVDVLMRLMRWEEAEGEVQELMKRFPEDAQVAYLGAAVAFRRGEFEEAATRSSDSIRFTGTPLEAYRIRALSRFMIQDYEGFRSDFELLIERDPDNADAYYHLGRYYYEKQLFREALPMFAKAIEKDSQHYKALYFLGWCQQARGELPDAKESYSRAIEIVEAEEVNYGWPFSDLGDLLITEGDYEAGMALLDRGRRNDPELPYVQYMFAKGRFKKEASDEVGESLLRAIELDPGYAEAFYLLGRYYQRKGDREKARDALARFQQLRENPKYSPHGLRRTSTASKPNQ